MKFIIIEDLDDGKFLHIDLRFKISWVDSKHDATPLEYTWESATDLERMGLCKDHYIWHSCDAHGNFI